LALKGRRGRRYHLPDFLGDGEENPQEVNLQKSTEKNGSNLQENAHEGGWRRSILSPEENRKGFRGFVGQDWARLGGAGPLKRTGDPQGPKKKQQRKGQNRQPKP